jgi:hypothetical protein
MQEGSKFQCFSVYLHMCALGDPVNVQTILHLSPSVCSSTGVTVSQAAIAAVRPHLVLQFCTPSPLFAPIEEDLKGSSLVIREAMCLRRLLQPVYLETADQGRLPLA